jgi:hypothetical protein
MTAAACRRFEAGRRYLARQRGPLGPSDVADAGRKLSGLLPEWG